MSLFEKLFLALAFVFSLTPSAWAQKINGITFVGTPERIDQSLFEPVQELGASHVCFVPFAYASEDSPELIWKNIDWQWWGESLEGTRESIRLAKSKGLLCVVKPQVWIRHGSFTGHFELSNNEEWEIFEAGYREYLLAFAEMCEKEGVELLSVGTELCAFVEHREEFWRQLIADVRTVYSGKLTYAANWDSYTRVPFWSELDYIGVDAYFPLTSQETPKLKSLLFAWHQHHRELEAISKENNKPILFTEFGYRSVDRCAKEPWLSNRGGTYNAEAQLNAYQAIFTRFWEEDWFAGGLVWKWFPQHDQSGGSTDNRFTPQNKPAENLIRTWFKKS